ncbi:MAG: isoaspartyl peptidase/L-asparaginase [Nitrospirota bacterium]
MRLIVHGGAGSRRPSKRVLKKLSESISSGFRVLQEGGTSLDAVSNAIVILEDSGLFNAGAGGNLQMDGARRLDASLMEGSSLRAGTVIGLEGIRNPIKMARIIMDLPHTVLTNTGAKKIAEAHNLPPLHGTDKEDLARLEKKRKCQKEIWNIYGQYFSTVGAVALDAYGNLAAGSSTGGVSAMLPGRVGDTPMIGSGIYAENSLGAAACTGIGEYILRLVLAKEICMNLQYMSLRTSSSTSLRRLICLGGQAGVILLDRKGHFAITHSTAYMPSGFASSRGVSVRENFRNITVQRRRKNLLGSN